MANGRREEFGREDVDATEANRDGRFADHSQCSDKPGQI